MISIGDDDHETRQIVRRQICGQVRKIDHLIGRACDVAQNVAVPGCSIVPPVIGGAVIVIRRCDGPTRFLVRLRLDLPGDAATVQFTEDVVVGYGIARGRARVIAIVAIAVEIMSSPRQGAVGG